MPFLLAGLTLVGLGLIFPIATTLYFLLDARRSRSRRRASSAIADAALYVSSLIAAFGIFLLGGRYASPGLLVFLVPGACGGLIAAGLSFRAALVARAGLTPRPSAWRLAGPALAGPLVFLLVLSGVGRFGSRLVMADLGAWLSSSCAPKKAFGDRACTNRREIRSIARVSEEALDALTADRVFRSDDGERLGVGNRIYSSDGSSSELPVDVADAHGPAFSPDGRHFAFREKAEGGCVRLVLDGRAGKCYRSVRFPVIGPGQRVAYVASEASPPKQFAVIDGAEQKGYAFVRGAVAFSPNGAHFAYVAGGGRGGPFYLILDGKELTFGDALRDPVVTDEGIHYGFISEGCVAPGHCGYGFRERVAWDGRLGKPYEKISALAAVPGRNEAIYLAQDGRQTRVVRGSAESDPFDIARRVVSPDGKHVAYAGELRSADARGLNIRFRSEIGIDGTKLGPLDGSISGPAFSADGTQVAWIRDDHDKTLVIRNRSTGAEAGVPLGWDFSPGEPRFSPDGTRLAFRFYYSDRTSWGTISFFSRGEVGGGYVHDWVSDPVFAPGGDSVAYWALDGAKLSYVREFLP